MATFGSSIPPAGRLNRQVQIQSCTTAQDAFGQRTQTWTTIATPWAHIEPLDGRKLELAQAINAEVTHQLTLHYRTGITTAHRVLYQTRVYNVHAVLDPEMAHTSLHLLCSEGLNQG